MTLRNSRRNRLPIAIALIGLAAYGWLAWSVYRSKKDPEGFRAWNGPGAWIVGPSGSDLQRAADRRIDRAMVAIDELSYDRYREHLTVARDLLQRSLRAQPRQADARTKLAAVSWELEPALTEEGVAGYLEQIAEASARAPNSPDIQFRLGKLLMGMWRPEEARAYLRRTVELDPAYTERVAEFLLAQGLAPRELLERLPTEPEVLAGLGRYFADQPENAEAYLAACESRLNAATAELVRWYGVVGRRIGDPVRVLLTIDGLEARSDPRVEAERLIQRARALSHLGEHAEALSTAADSVRHAPDVARLHDEHGEIALAASDLDQARVSFGEAIAILARSGGADAYRAVLYRKIGDLEQRVRRPDRAYDAYRRALALDPSEAIARARLEAIMEAAGITPALGESAPPSP